MAQHYTAVVTITRTTETQLTTTSSGTYGRREEPQRTERSSEEVVKLVVRAETVESLASKVGAHMALLGEA